jgi:catechol 2,3-dioxygenase-like lactoylglutathione lyase family enzyme
VHESPNDGEVGMSGSTTGGQSAHHWYARPVLFVSDVHAALRFYTDSLGFQKRWHSDDGAGTVCQVDRGDCEIILCQDPARRDRSRLFIELTRDGIDELRREIAARAVPNEMSWWGYDVIRIVDPDGNELLFPLDETNDIEYATRPRRPLE